MRRLILCSSTFSKINIYFKNLIKQNIINSSEFASNLKAAREIQALEFSPLTQKNELSGFV